MTALPPWHNPAGSDVPDYRLYFFDDRGHIRHALEFECASDDEALEVVEQHRDGRDMELWHRARFIRKFSKLPKG